MMNVDHQSSIESVFDFRSESNEYGTCFCFLKTALSLLRFNSFQFLQFDVIKVRVDNIIVVLNIKSKLLLVSLQLLTESWVGVYDISSLDDVTQRLIVRDALVPHQVSNDNGGRS
jgi:hypothetical protein